MTLLTKSKDLIIGTDRHASGKEGENQSMLRHLSELQAGMPAKFKSLGAWRWAAATVASRTMHLPDDAAGALMPFGDLHNHRSPPAATQPDLGERAKSCFTLCVGLPSVDLGDI